MLFYIFLVKILCNFDESNQVQVKITFICLYNFVSYFGMEKYNYNKLYTSLYNILESLFPR